MEEKEAYVEGTSSKKGNITGSRRVRINEIRANGQGGASYLNDCREHC